MHTCVYACVCTHVYVCASVCLVCMLHVWVVGAMHLCVRACVHMCVMLLGARGQEQQSGEEPGAGPEGFLSKRPRGGDRFLHTEL